MLESESGQLLRTIGSEGSGDGLFNGPEGILFDDAHGQLIVCDSDNQRLQLLEESGKCLFKIGDSDLFSMPMRVALSPDGSTMAVADMFNHRIMVFRRDTTTM